MDEENSFTATSLAQRSHLQGTGLNHFYKVDTKSPHSNLFGKIITGGLVCISINNAHRIWPIMGITAVTKCYILVVNYFQFILGRS
jgi:hypothetical protein